jgi:hypothetical protein
MTEEQAPHSLSSEPPPRAPEKKKAGWKKPFIIVTGIIGIIASTSSVVALFWGWFDPDTTQADQARALQDIEKRLAEDGPLVNQVSRRVTELGDEYKRIQANLADIRRLDESLAKKTKTALMTPGQKKLTETSRSKEIEELQSLVGKTEKLAKRFIESVEKDETLGKVEPGDSETAQNKSRAQSQAKLVREKLLAEMTTIRSKHKN